MECVYKITNTVNDRIYIGYTSKSMEHRWNQHCGRAYNRSFEKSKLYTAMRKYGKESFVVETIYEGKDALEKENDFIIKYNSKETGYNTVDGGSFPATLGKIFTKEEKQKMSESMKSSKAHKIGIEKRNTSEYRKKMAKVARSTTKNRKKYDVWNKGMVGVCFASKETKKLMSKQRMGRKWFNDGIKEYFRFEKEDDWYMGRLVK